MTITGNFILAVFCFGLSTTAAMADYGGYDWFRSSQDGVVRCYVSAAPLGSPPVDQRYCSPSGFAWFNSSQDGLVRCYSIDAPRGAEAVDASYCN